MSQQVIDRPVLEQEPFTAEHDHFQLWEQQFEFTGWQTADEIAPELVKEADSRVQTVAAMAVGSEVEVELVESNDPTECTTTLKDAIVRAANGDEDSLQLVKTNVMTDYAERVYKSKHQTKVRFDFDGSCLTQNGRKNVDVYRNTLDFAELNPLMHMRTLTEYRNAEVFDLMAEQGVFDDFNVLVASPMPEDESTIEKFNFFSKTASMSLQLMTKDDQGFALETAFVAGKVSEDAPRHDIDAIKNLACSNGIELNMETVDELLQFVILVPKSTVPNGVCDIVEMYDDAAGGTFYGEAEPRQDYATFADQCLAKDFMVETELIASQLLSSAHLLHEPIDANNLLDELSGKQAVLVAVHDRSIDERIFGALAARSIQEARIAQDMGNIEAMQRLTVKAQQTETSGSCPFSSGKNSGGYGSEYEFGDMDEDKYGSLTFNCPHCNKKNRRPKNQLIQHCQHSSCGKDVSC